MPTERNHEFPARRVLRVEPILHRSRIGACELHDGLDALKRLIDDVRSGAVDFSAILVYDVSRWGRFQNADESAYYEFICKEAGITVHYCAEQFENDGSLSSTIIKSMKRAMAGE